MRGRLLRRWPRLALALGLVALVAAGTAIAIAPQRPYDLTFTAKSESEIQNIDVVRAWLKNYYGAPGAAAGPTGAWKAALNQDSNYAAEARSVAEDGATWLNAHKPKSGELKAIVLDVDDTSLTTWNYELFSNWIFDACTNANFVGLTGPSACPTLPQTTFTGNLFPATPGMVELATQAKADGYALFFITGRGDAQHQATIANLVDEAAVNDPVNYPSLSVVQAPSPGAGLPEIDAHYPTPTAVNIGHPVAAPFMDGLFTKPATGSGATPNQYPAYLNKPEFCAAAIASNASCPTTRYKSGTRAYIENTLGYDIVANFGDQFNDLDGGFADKTFKMPNPNYYLTG
jgi:predicted secreted acid phosphatase